MASASEGFWTAAWKPVVGAAAVGAAAWFWDALSAVWARVLGHLSASITLSNWQWYLLAFLSAHSTMYWAWRLIRANMPSHRRFNQDNFFGARWCWTYDISGAPGNLVPRCPACDLDLSYEHVLPDRYSGEPERLRLHCDKCGTVPLDRRGDLSYTTGLVRREIERLIRTGEWEKRAPPK